MSGGLEVWVTHVTIETVLSPDASYHFMALGLMVLTSWCLVNRFGGVWLSAT